MSLEKGGDVVNLFLDNAAQNVVDTLCGPKFLFKQQVVEEFREYHDDLVVMMFDYVLELEKQNYLKENIQIENSEILAVYEKFPREPYLTLGDEADIIDDFLCRLTEIVEFNTDEDHNFSQMFTAYQKELTEMTIKTVVEGMSTNNVINECIMRSSL